MTAGTVTAKARPHTGTRYLILGQDMCSMDAGMDDHLLASSLQCIRLRHYILKPCGDGQTIKTNITLPGGKEEDCFNHGDDVT